MTPETVSNSASTQTMAEGNMSPFPDLPTEAVAASPWVAAWTLCERELVRFVRQRSRLIGAIGQPLLFWVLFGAGFRGSFQIPNVPIEFGQYFFPGIVVLVVLFTAIFATISIIQDRHEGFLQGVLIAPIPRWSLVLGKVLGGAMLALIQAWLFFLLAPLAGIQWSVVSVLAASAFLLLEGTALTSLGVCLAWKTDSVQGFHAMMTLVLMPMWLLSGAFFPAEGGPAWLAWIIRLNPVTYGVAGFRRILSLSTPAAAWADLPSMPLCLAVTTGFAVVFFLLALWLVGSHSGERS